MSITRRQFLLGMTGTAAGLVIPTYLTRATLFLEETGSPLILPPEHIDTELLAVDKYDEFELNLGDPYIGPPDMTHREFADKYRGYQNVKDYLESEFGDESEWPDPDSSVDYDTLVESWARHDSPQADAYYLLEGLDLMPESGDPSAIGELIFTDGACPGNDYLGVSTPDKMSLSLLQERLNQLDTGIHIILEGGA